MTTNNAPQFDVKFARLGNEKQQAAGIFMTFSLDVRIGQTVLLGASDLMLRKNKNGEFYIASPSRSYQKDGETKWISFIRFFPEKESRDKQDKLTELVVGEYNNQLKTPATANSSSSSSSSDPW